VAIIVAVEATGGGLGSVRVFVVEFGYFAP